MTYSINEIAEIVKTARPINSKRHISILLTDSRSLVDAEQSLFFAIRTPNNDGHRYIADLYAAGVRCFVVDHIPDKIYTFEDADFIVVPDTTRALQTIAQYHRRKYNIPVVGITGSRGKTTVKEWLYQLLQADYHIVRSPRSYNSQIGVPLSIWEMDDETELAIFEAGISQPGEMVGLQSVIRPNIGIITNIGSEHDEGFKSLRQKCDEKVTLFRDCECVIYNGDDDCIHKSIDAACISAKEIAWSKKDSDVPLFIQKIDKRSTETEIHFSYIRRDGVVTVPFTSDADIENAIHCLAFALYLNCPMNVLASRMRTLSPVRTRLDVIDAVNGCMLIYDSYTADLRSMTPALDFMARRSTAGCTSTVIISDMTHEQMAPMELYAKLAHLLKQRGIQRVVGVGPELMQYKRYFDVNAVFYLTTDELLKDMSASDFEHELILIKGASSFHFERIAEQLEARHHETILEVNLDSVVHNFNFFRSHLKPTTGIVAMVKASGYGAGSYELAKTMQAQGAAYLAVAAVDEGVDLREAGITMPIMVLNPKVVNYKTLFAYNLEPEIYSLDILDEIIREGVKRGIENYPVHLKLDTGMHRLGFLENDIPDVVARVLEQNTIQIKSVFSHLATADCPDMDDYTNMQLSVFDSCCDKLQSMLGEHHSFMRHILNSTGILRFPEHQCDMVRLGIGLYGIKTLDDGTQDALRPVSSLHTIIISIKEWNAGTTIGYSRKGVLTRQSRIATIPVGYADGLNRHLGNGHSSVWINGHRCPIVGNICMDACMVDVTDVECTTGDAVEIFGEHIPAAELAEILGTIPYEVLTSVSTRVKRVYYRE
jgi:alanine racemase